MGKKVMRHLRMLAIAGLLAIGSSWGAAAADLPLPPAPELIPIPEAEFGGWYLRGDVGAGIGHLSSQNSSFNPAVTVDGFGVDSHDVHSAFLAGAGIGYQFNSWFRADITGEWRNKQGYRVNESYNDIFGIGCANGRCGDAYYGKVQTTGLFLANGYFDLGTWSGFTPYVGVGLGTAYTKFGPIQDFGTDPMAAGYGYAPANTNWHFAWALMAGVGYAITPNLIVDVGYRYLDLGKIKSEAIGCGAGGVCANEVQSVHLASHDVRVGLRWLFGAPVPLPPPPPLVRKY
jgi:opacity protein-like surface antigen